MHLNAAGEVKEGNLRWLCVTQSRDSSKVVWAGPIDLKQVPQMKRAVELRHPLRERDFGIGYGDCAQYSLADDQLFLESARSLQ